jgi:Kef-type K+ transport system membrane component KefB
VAEPGVVAAVPAASHAGAPGSLLLALTAILIACQLAGRLVRYLGQPPVIGEVIAGILLGPSLLGRLAPQAATFLLPDEAAPVLGAIAQLGVILYMFLVGLELNTDLIRAQARVAVAVSSAGIVAPLLLGVLLAVGLHTRLAPDGVPFTSFALFLGAALSITAFPVLARILRDRRMTRTEFGCLALSCAAANDVMAWCLLALVVSVAQTQLGGAFMIIFAALAYLAFMAVLVRPVAVRLVRRWEGRPGATAYVFIALLLSALATEAIGVHALFGAFLLGAVIPHDSSLAKSLERRTSDLVSILLLPAFFAYTGMRIQIGLIEGMEGWLICGLIILVAMAGKFGGTLVAARLTGLTWRTSAALGVLMNTRGLMELIVLNVGLDLGIITPKLFAMMVLMALVTTMATTPLLALFHSRATAAEAPSQGGHSAKELALGAIVRANLSRPTSRRVPVLPTLAPRSLP